MKIRNFFVSNSSTSSFCVIGLYNNERIEKLVNKLEELGLDDDHPFEYDGNYGYFGLPIRPLLDIHNIPDACVVCRDGIKKILDIEVPLSEIDFQSGEVIS